MPHNLLPLLPVLLLSMLRSPPVQATLPYPLKVDCPAKYTANPTYLANLRELLLFLNTSALRDGFSTKSVGEPPDQVFGMVFCEADIGQTNCQSCVQNLITTIDRNCPESMNMTLWDLLCIVRYSSKHFLSSIDNYSFGALGDIVWLNPSIDPEIERFNLSFNWLMSNLSDKAAYHTSNKFAVGSVNYAGSKTIYGMQQCTLDLSSDTCHQCLQYLLGTIPATVGAASGASMYTRSCLVRYGLYIFYSVSDPNSIVTLPPLQSTIPVNNPDNRNKSAKGTKKKKRSILVISGVSVLAVILIPAVWIFLRRIKRRKKKSSEDEERSLQTVNIATFSFNILNEATNNFSAENKLGHGGFAEVYKGTIKDGQEIAVKRFYSKSEKLLPMLKSGVALMASLHHTNLVKLLGYCFENHENLLVYEFLPNRSLNRVLFDPTGRKQLDWKTRFMIIEGICRGLLYLHRDSGKNIIHRDLKPENILLDRDMTAKIADFDLAKTFDIDKTHESTEFVGGTIGYMAPELIRHHRFSTKTDTYSYGVMVLEILTGQQIREFTGSSDAMSLVDYVWQHWNAMAALAVLDPLISKEYHTQGEEVLKCIQVGLLCLQSDPAKRPNMQEVMVMLHSNRDLLPTPSNPGYLSRLRVFKSVKEKALISEETALPAGSSMSISKTSM